MSETKGGTAPKGFSAGGRLSASAQRPTSALNLKLCSVENSFSLAIANVRRPETHKRLMYLIMAAFMHPAIARVMLTLFAPPAAHGPPQEELDREAGAERGADDGQREERRAHPARLRSGSRAHRSR